MKKTITVLFLVSIVFGAFAQNDANGVTAEIRYEDEFGNTMTKREFRKQKRKNDAYVFNEALYVIKPKFYQGTITDQLKSKVVSFLQLKSKTTIKKTDILIINAEIVESECNIQNIGTYQEYLQKIKSLDKNIRYFEIKTEESERFKDQFIDDSLLIFNHFFRYHSWKVNYKSQKCGGTLVIYPDNTFKRFVGDGESMKIFKNFKL